MDLETSLISCCRASISNVQGLFFSYARLAFPKSLDWKFVNWWMWLHAWNYLLVKPNCLRKLKLVYVSLSLKLECRKVIIWLDLRKGTAGWKWPGNAVAPKVKQGLLLFMHTHPHFQASMLSFCCLLHEKWGEGLGGFIMWCVPLMYPCQILFS